MTRHHERPARHGPRGPRRSSPMPIDAVWEEGPRTEAWNKLWRRLIAAVLEDYHRERGDTEHDSDSGAREAPEGEV